MFIEKSLFKYWQKLIVLPNTHTSLQRLMSTMPINRPNSRCPWSASLKNCGKYICGAMGMKPLLIAKPQYRRARAILRSVSPAYGEQINTNGRYLALFAVFSICVSASYAVGVYTNLKTVQKSYHSNLKLGHLNGLKSFRGKIPMLQ